MLPMADGGEGTVHALVSADNGILQEVEVTGPLGKKVKAQFGLYHQKQRAVLEMASASGIALLDRDVRIDPVDFDLLDIFCLIIKFTGLVARRILVSSEARAAVNVERAPRVRKDDCRQQKHQRAIPNYSAIQS